MLNLPFTPTHVHVYRFLGEGTFGEKSIDKQAKACTCSFEILLYLKHRNSVILLL